MWALWTSQKTYFGELEEVDVIAIMCKSAVGAGDALVRSFETLRAIGDTPPKPLGNICGS